MLAAGLAIVTIGTFVVFVPQDLVYLGLDRATLDNIDPLLVPLIAHDRAGFGGGLATAGLTVLARGLVRAPEPCAVGGAADRRGRRVRRRDRRPRADRLSRPVACRTGYRRRPHVHRRDRAEPAIDGAPGRVACVSRRARRGSPFVQAPGRCVEPDEARQDRRSRPQARAPGPCPRGSGKRTPNDVRVSRQQGPVRRRVADDPDRRDAKRISVADRGRHVGRFRLLASRRPDRGTKVGERIPRLLDEQDACRRITHADVDRVARIGRSGRQAEHG